MTFTPRSIGTAARLGAAAAIVVGGLVHLQLYFDGYRDVPDANLGRSFVVNGVVSVLVAGALVVRRETFVRLAGIALVVGTLVAFALSRTSSGVFGFSESGLNPSPQATITLAAEIASLVLLGLTFLPAVGPGRVVPVRVALVPVVALVGVTALMSALWNRESPPSPAADGSDTTLSSASTEVSIVDFAFGPKELRVGVGETVVWRNDDGAAHTVDSPADEFGSDRLERGDSYEFTFAAAGSYAYICGLHPSMTATIVVS